MKKPEFSSSKKAESTRLSGGENAGSEGNSQNKGGGESIEDAMKRYSGMSESQLVTEMLARAAEGREKGTLTDGDLDDFYAKAAPMLSNAQREKLKGLVDSLKQGK